MSVPNPPPKVFVSYSWSSGEHKKWVLDLAERLMSDGIAVILDVWELKPGQDKYVFMEKAVTDKSVCKVLVVCDRAYAEKADGRKGGVGTEAQLISHKVYNEVSQEKFLTVVRERDDEGNPWLPAFMISRIYFDFTNDEDFEDAYESLMRNIHSAPELKKPPLGKVPAHIFNTDTAVLITAGKFQRLSNAVEKNKPNIEIYLRDYLENLSEALETFRITTAPLVKVEPDEITMDRINQMRPYRDQFIDFCYMYATNIDTDSSYSEVHDFLERILAFHHRTEPMLTYYEWYFEHHKFMSYEWMLYLLATLIHAKKHKTAARFMGDTYQYRLNGGSKLTNCGIREFNNPLTNFEDRRKQRLNLNRYSIVADLIKEGATNKRITFNCLYEVDILLVFRPLILDPKDHFSWFPRLIAYCDLHSDAALDVFARANTEKGLSAIRDLFSVRDAKELAHKLQLAFKNQDLNRFFNGERHWYGQTAVTMVNWEELKRLIEK